MRQKVFKFKDHMLFTSLNLKHEEVNEINMD